jgi:hypothetical protein
MGNRLSVAPPPQEAPQTHARRPREVVKGARGTTSHGTWLMGRLEKKTATQHGRRRRLSTRDSDYGVETKGLVRGMSHSDATTLSQTASSSLLFARGLSGDSDEGTVGSSGEGFSLTRQPEDYDDDDEIDRVVYSRQPSTASSSSSIRRTSNTVWQQLVGYVSTQRAPCCGPHSPPASPKKHRHAAEHTIADMEEKHRLFWELVQRLLVLNDVVAMMREVHEYLINPVGASQCAVFLVDPNRNSMSRVMRGQETLSNISQLRGLVGHALATKESLCRQLFAQDLHYDAEVDLPQESVFQRLLCVPLIDNNNVYAVVQMTTQDASRNGECDHLDMKLISWLGPILSSCMRKCIEFHDVLLSDRTQKALLHIISSSDTEDTVLNLIDGVIAGAGHITKSERLSLFMIDWETEELWTLSSSYHEETIRVAVEGSTLGYAARHRMTLNIADADKDPRYIADLDQRRGIQTRCALYVPVGVENGMSFDENSRPMAVLEILNKHGGESFSIDDECAFEAFASEVAVILRRRSNEIEYIKLLADTRAEKVLAQRAKSQVNLLECFTEYVANANANRAADRLRHSFFKNHSRGCVVCSEDKEGGTTNCTNIDCRDIDNHRDFAQAATATCAPIEELPSQIAVTVGPQAAPVPMWDFNIFAADADSLPVMVRDIFLDFHVPEILQCDEVTLRNFIFAVKETYHPNPFHNYVHAVSVVHMTYMILKTTEAGKMLQPLDIAACLIAAYCHDVDHPGHTNTFEIVTKSPLALLYSDDSVLERHHASTTFRILKEKNANILQNLSTSDYRYLRKMIVTAILSTDMAQHFKMCESMEKALNPTPHHKSNTSVSVKRESAPSVIESCGGAVIDHHHHPTSISGAPLPADQSATLMEAVREAVFSNEPGSTPGTGAKTLAARVAACSMDEQCTSSSPFQCNFNGTLEERTFLVRAVVHASDLCGQTFPKPIALKWSNMISKEFAYQALLEQADNLPVSFKQLDDPLEMVEGQHFFAHKIVFPLWSLMHQMFPELEMCIKNLTDNVNHYDKEIQRLKHHKQWTLAMAAAHEAAAAAGGDGNLSDSSSAGDAPWCHSDDEGMAVPGVARCTPAKFNSFRALKSLSRPVSTGAIDETVYGSVAIDAIELARSRSEFHRARSSSTESSADEADVEREDEIFEINDLNNPQLLLTGLS